MVGHDLKSGKTVGLILPWIFWNVNSKMIGKLNISGADVICFAVMQWLIITLLQLRV